MDKNVLSRLHGAFSQNKTRKKTRACFLQANANANSAVVWNKIVKTDISKISQPPVGGKFSQMDVASLVSDDHV